jgi:hypothetical protein
LERFLGCVQVYAPALRVGDHRGGLEHVERRAPVAAASGGDVFEGRVLGFDPQGTQASLGVPQSPPQQLDEVGILERLEPEEQTA